MAEWRERLSEAFSERTGRSIVPRERLELLEAADVERRALQRELDLLAYTALDYAGGRAQELKPLERRNLVQKARVAWMKDPQAGAAVDLMNDFVLGRGLPKPSANDPLVQEKIDEAWDDPDNQLVLTSYGSQLALCTDLSLQSNLFLLVFDSGEDGKVKLGLLEHDSVENVVRDEDNRLKILYYVARHWEEKWDFKNDMPLAQLIPRGADGNLGEVRYYEHWRNVSEKEEAGETFEHAPKEKLGDGKVFHVAINRTSEMAFGHPIFDRTLRWFNAYNAFMDARLDIIQGRAAMLFKRKVKGSQTQLERMATRALSRRSTLSQAEDPELVAGPKAGSIINENENLTWEPMNQDTAAASAMQDSQMIRAQTSAAMRFPQSYFGDASSANLATATSLELPVLKAVETRQEIVESLGRFFIDRVIERAVDQGEIPEELEPDERQERIEAALLARVVREGAGFVRAGERPEDYAERVLKLIEAHEDAVEDEIDTQRDLGYEFSLPSPLKRMLADVVTAVMNVARTFDPNNTNIELSRTLLTIAFSEGFELEDPQGAVDRIFPEGYEDPAVAAAQAQFGGGAPAQPFSPFGEFAPAIQPTGAVGADGRRHPAGNPYGAKQQARPAELAMREAMAREHEDSPLMVRRRDGTLMPVQEARFSDLDPAVQEAMRRRQTSIDADFEMQVASLLGPRAGNTSNGNGNGR